MPRPLRGRGEGEDQGTPLKPRQGPRPWTPVGTRVKRGSRGRSHLAGFGVSPNFPNYRFGRRRRQEKRSAENFPLLKRDTLTLFMKNLWQGSGVRCVLAPSML